MHAPASAFGDPAEFFDVDVDQLAWAAAFVAADDLPGGPVHEGQAVQAMPDQDAVDGRDGQAQDRADAARAQLALLPQTADLRLSHCRSPVRRRAGSAGTVVQAGLALCSPSAQPLVGRGPRDAHLGRDMRDRTAGTDTLDQQSPAVNSQPGITVGHEDLRAVKS